MKELIMMVCLFFVLGGTHRSQRVSNKKKREDYNKTHPAIKKRDIQPLMIECGWGVADMYNR